MSERSEFAGPPADNVRSEGTPEGAARRARFFAYFLVARQESQSPAGAKSRPVKAKIQNYRPPSVQHEPRYTAQSQTHRIRISSSDASTAHTLLCTIRNTVLGVPFPCEPPSAER